MSRKQAGYRHGVAGPDLQALLSYAYAVQCLRARQQQALGKLAWHALQAVSGQSLAIGSVQKSQLRWLTAVGHSAGDGEQLALPRQIADLELSSFGVEPVAGVEPGQYPVHVYPGAGSVPSTAYVLIGRAATLQGVLAICRHTTEGFSENDVRMMRIFAMSVDQVLAWSPSHPVPDGMEEITRPKVIPPPSTHELLVGDAALLDRTPEGQGLRSEDEPRFGFGLFEDEAPERRSLWLKLSVALATLVLLGLALGLYSRKGKPEVSQQALNPVAESTASPVATTPRTSAVTPAPVSAPTTDVRPQGLRVENPDPGVTYWQPSAHSTTPVRLEHVRLHREKDQLFLIFELTGDTGIRIEHAGKPERVLVRFAGAKMSSKLKLRANDPIIAGFSARATTRGSEVEIRLRRHASVMLVGPTAGHHVILNIQG